MNGVGRILIVEDDAAVMRVTRALLEASGHHVSSAVDVAQGLEILSNEPQDLVLSDLHLPDGTGMELLKHVRAHHPETAFIIMTAYGSIESAVEAVRSGAYDYITKPIHPDALKASVERALERFRLLAEVRALRSAFDRKFGFETIIGNAKKLMRALDEATSVAHTDATVLILGETGTGKEVLAKAIHAASPRRQRPFVVISCGSIPRELLESELFGHLKGAFTGAYTHKKGKVEQADGGTVFLDEIGEMPIELQVRVLRLVQEREIEKIGAPQSQKVNVRIIAATHRNLESRVAEGLFREDLYYRLAVIPIELPPLRERKDDIPALVEEFFARATGKHERQDLVMPKELMPYFVNYRWPGNIRELENLIERIVLLNRSDRVTLASLPPALTAEHSVMKDAGTALSEDSLGLEGAERQLIVQSLRKFNWNQTQTARYLNISRKTLVYRIAKHGIEKGSSFPSQEPRASEDEDSEQ